MDVRIAFSILGIEPITLLAEGKKRYRELCKEFHPDKGGNSEDFRNIVSAWEIVEPMLLVAEVPILPSFPEVNVFAIRYFDGSIFELSGRLGSLRFEMKVAK